MAPAKAAAKRNEGDASGCKYPLSVEAYVLVWGQNKLHDRPYLKPEKASVAISPKNKFPVPRNEPAHKGQSTASRETQIKPRSEMYQEPGSLGEPIRTHD